MRGKGVAGGGGGGQCGRMHERETWWRRHPLLVTALTPVLPQMLGSVFNIWYNGKVIAPLLHTEALQERFMQTVVVFNLLAYPMAVALWVRWVYVLRPAVEAAEAGGRLEGERALAARQRAVNLPWLGAALAGGCWLACIPVFLGAFAQVQWPLPAGLLAHLPVSFLVSALISITHSFFLVELASHRLIFPRVFAGVRPEQTPGTFPLSLRGRGLLWAVSAGICPIGSLLLLSFAPESGGAESAWFELFVGSVGIAFGLCTALMVNRLVAEPVDQLAAAVRAVAEGRLDVRVESHRADEFGLLINEFNTMVQGLRDRDRLRHAFGLHVGRRAAERILQRDPGLSGMEEVVTVMFVDVRGFTARCRGEPPARIVGVLNLFLTHMVRVVEEEHGGMINKFLGDGFMALFGAGGIPERDAEAALAAARGMLRELEEVNAALAAKGEAPLRIGIGLHRGPAVVGSIGSPERLEFTVIGDTVNLASRVEGLTKEAGEGVLLTDAVAAALGDAACRSLRKLEARGVKGVDEPVGLWGLGG